MKKFVIEIVRSIGAADKVLSHVEIEEDSFRKARLKAELLLAPWRDLGATGTRVLRDDQGQTRRHDR